MKSGANLATVDAWRVVVIEDSPDDVAEIRRLLRRGSDRRYQFVEAATGAAGVRAVFDASGGLPDCVVLDYNLPDTDALEMLPALIGPDGLTVCPIVVLTGSAVSQLGPAVLWAGAQDFIGKDWMTEESLTRAVENAAQRWAMGRELHARTSALQASEVQLRLATEVAGMAVTRIDYRTHTAVLDTIGAALFGLDAGVPLPRAVIHAAFHPDDKEEILRLVDQCLDPSGDGCLFMEHRIVHQDGSIRWVDVKKQVTFSEIAGVRRPMTGVLATIDITTRKQAEQQLRASDAFNRSLMNASADCIKVMDLDGQLLFINEPGLCAMEIDDFAPMCGQPWPTLWPADLGPEIQRAVAAARAGETYSFQAFCPTVKGKPRWWDVTVSAVRDPVDGQVVRLLAVSRDITDRKQHEATLVARERELQMLADNTPDILARFDRELRHVFVNAAVEPATGRNREDFLGRTHRELGLPAHLCDHWEAAIRDVFDHGQPKLIDFTLEAPEGTRYYCSRMVPEIGPDGEVEFVLGVTQDVTDAQAAEAAVRVSEERLARAQRAARVGTWDWDIVLGRASWTAEAWQLFGRSADIDGPVTQDLWRSCLHPDDRDRAAAAITAALAAGPYRDEFRIRYRDGREAWLESEGEVIRDNTGAAARMLGTVRDISDRKLALEGLRVADKRKDEFLATLAHELRNPLAPIRTGLSILQMARLPDQAEKVVGMMDRQLGHMVNLVDDLLDVSRVRTGKITLRVERVTVREVVDAAVEACRPSIDEKSHTLEVDLAAKPMWVTGDNTRLVQVVTNLLTNAAKYSEPGARIRLSAASEGGQAVIRVSDTGMGIAPELLPTLWDLFTQVRDTLDKAQGGLGIGLSLVKHLVDMHGGTVTAESAGVGHGSTFTVRLPLAAAADQSAATSSARRGPAPAPLAARRVLVVDDSVDAAELLTMLLQISGHTTATAHSGLDALETARTFTPDIVFLDIGLPDGMDGYEVARRFRADPLMAEIVLVALTGWGSEADKRMSKDAGFDCHLVKPVEADSVEAVIARLCVTPVSGGKPHDGEVRRERPA